MIYFIPDVNHYLKVLSDKEALQNEFNVMTKVCQKTTFVPSYYNFYESKTSILEKFPQLTNLPDDAYAIEMEAINAPTWSHPITNGKQILHLMKQLMDILELLYHEGCIYTDFNLSNFLITTPLNYCDMPTLYLIDFTYMIHFYKETSFTPSMDVCSRGLLTHHFDCHSLRDRVLFLHRMVSISALRFAGLMDIPLDYECPKCTLLSNEPYYQKAKKVLTEPFLDKINFGFCFDGQIDEHDIFSRWRKLLG